VTATLTCATRGTLFRWDGPAYAGADGVPAARAAFTIAVRAIAFAKGADHENAAIPETTIDIGPGFHDKTADSWIVEGALIDAVPEGPNQPSIHVQRVSRAVTAMVLKAAALTAHRHNPHTEAVIGITRANRDGSSFRVRNYIRIDRGGRLLRPALPAGGHVQPDHGAHGGRGRRRAQRTPPLAAVQDERGGLGDSAGGSGLQAEHRRRRHRLGRGAGEGRRPGEGPGRAVGQVDKLGGVRAHRPAARRWPASLPYIFRLYNNSLSQASCHII